LYVTDVPPPRPSIRSRSRATPHLASWPSLAGAVALDVPALLKIARGNQRAAGLHDRNDVTHHKIAESGPGAPESKIAMVASMAIPLFTVGCRQITRSYGVARPRSLKVVKVR